ncbi:transcriptional regulator with GAF, ATPase, and Fis domain [Kibdelosporangium banguiense]|uniref:Transcriptional regulator with GAF, ATPase, and Fis domain n=1 Tax=Kibdelosporangium banguiense TaxID=1365924 RepID=A0ABS4TSK4_9PSEU|nr:GAF and ANTAR domain-containing protein [Kibdelosporangium banguiense]MBP2326979.1 transcriptional regulator with GAF, ATPase, and Fis domain [Kibdelosporangium banguiense]
MTRAGRSEDETRGTLAATLGEIARTLQAEPDVEATLAAIVKAAVDHIDGAERAGISLVEHGGRIRTVAPTDEVVTGIDDLQYRIRQGPCVDAITEHATYRTGDLAEESRRWPDLAPAAAEMGVRSMLSYRLFVTDTTLGALNLYATQRNAFSDQTEQDGRMFATHAAIALVGAQKQAHLHAALENRDIIGMAKGILMERHRVDPAQAFRILVEASQHANMKLHQVATLLVTDRNDL